jgi:NADP-dependent 3-hydroxy acid dehydrogenase YdfG
MKDVHASEERKEERGVMVLREKVAFVTGASSGMGRQ